MPGSSSNSKQSVLILDSCDEETEQNPVRLAIDAEDESLQVLSVRLEDSQFVQDWLVADRQGDDWEHASTVADFETMSRRSRDFAENSTTPPHR